MKSVAEVAITSGEANRKPPRSDGILVGKASVNEVNTTINAVIRLPKSRRLRKSHFVGARLWLLIGA